MKAKFKELFKEIKYLINYKDNIFVVNLIRKDDSYSGPKALKPVRLSNDKTQVICELFIDDTLEQMAEKVVSAGELEKEVYEYKTHKKESPELFEALVANIPELNQNFY